MLPWQLPCTKKDQLASVSFFRYRSAFFRYMYRPDPDDPGGLGAEESGTERTGPTHIVYFAM